MFFDSLGYVKALEEAGMERNIAEAQAQAVQASLNACAGNNRNALASKDDVTNTHLEIQKLRMAMQTTENHIRNWILGAMVAQMAFLMAIASGIFK